ncbi:MAG: ATP-binding protein, partial [Candidatus Aenigmatarchaeota archaeon]
MDEKITLPLAERFAIDAQELVTGRTCVIAQSGAGKSYLIAVLCEKMLEQNVPFCIIDTEGEYFSLKEKFQLLWAGGHQADVELEKIDPKELARHAVKENVSVILDVSDVMDEKKTVADFVSALYEVETGARTPYLLILEEADKFAPQTPPKDDSSKAVLAAIEEISRRGRKRGLGLLVATQRPALINKNVLSQCGNQLIGKLTTENDLAAVNLFFASRAELEALPKLKQGEFFAMGNISRERVKFRSYPRQTQHKGLTPKLIPKASGKVSLIKSEVLHVKEGKKETEMTLPEKPSKARRVEGVPAVISKEKAMEWAEKKRRKKFGPFGQEERLTSFGMEWTPVAYVEATFQSGLIMKGLKTVSFFFNCANGNIVDLSNGYRTAGDLGYLANCSENECAVLLNLRKGKTATVAELQNATGLSESALRDITERLRTARLITWSKSKNVNYYSALVDARIPDFNRKAKYEAFETEVRGELLKPVFSEKDVRNIVKAMDKN